jgi:flagellar hook-length control protein FliK
MNTLAAVLHTASPAPAAAKPSASDDAAGSPGTFAQCMQQARHTQAAAAADDATSDEASANEADADTTDSADTSAAPDLSALLPGWTAAASAAATAAAPEPTAHADAPADAVIAAAGKRLAALTDAAATAKPEALTTPSPAADATIPMLALDAARDAATPAPAREPAVRTPTETRVAVAPEQALPLPAPASTTPPSSAAREADAAPPSAHLSAPPGTPAFAPALATQVRWWAQDGVQQAQLTMNPPEMGPVAVKIVVQHEQREARIDFVADVAATRSALEAALPALAAALDEAGLKLSGGGVHDGAAQRQALWQQSQQQQRQGLPTPMRGEGVAQGSERSSTAAAHTLAGRGLVDLVA